MTTKIWSAIPNQNTDADFRAWGKGISDALAAIGMVKTTDTGQVDWATQTKPVATSAPACYEMWRFNDALQATAPIFFKLGYGAGTTVSYPALFPSLGRGSDGAGNLTGLMVAQATMTAAATSSIAYPSYASSGDGSMLALLWAPQFPGHTILIERSRAVDGSPTGLGVLWVRGPAGTNGPSVLFGIDYVMGTSSALSGKWPAGIPTTTSADITLAQAGTAPVFPATAHAGSGSFWQPRSVLSGMRSDVGALGATFTVPGFGTYLAGGASAGGWDLLAGTYSTACFWWQ